MGSKERMVQLREAIHCNILNAAIEISRKDGWPALSMRKIADKINYTAPVIYEYFANKEALLDELAAMGFRKLSYAMKEAAQSKDTPEDKITAMWKAYWDFAFAEKEFYSLMYGVQVNCCQFDHKGAKFELPAELVWDVLETFPWAKGKNEEDICKIYYTYWSVVHGLVSINLVKASSIPDQISLDVFDNAIRAITNSLK